jgi:hypothetical protein
MTRRIITPQEARATSKKVKEEQKEREKLIEEHRRIILQKELESFNEKLELIFQASLEGSQQTFFEIDEFTDIQIRKLEGLNLLVRRIQSDRLLEKYRQNALDTHYVHLEKAVSRLEQYQQVLSALERSQSIDIRTFQIFLQDFWRSGRLTKESTGAHLIEILNQYPNTKPEEIRLAKCLLNEIVDIFILIKRKEEELREIKAHNAVFPPDCKELLHVNWDTTKKTTFSKNTSIYSFSVINWLASKDGQNFVDSLDCLIRYAAKDGKSDFYFVAKCTDNIWWSDDLVDFLEKNQEENAEHKVERIVLPPPQTTEQIIKKIGYECEAYIEDPDSDEEYQIISFSW